ncbi:MAG TPA: adenylate kinase [Cyanobacteria bacterium UBA8156]|jgi:adenylate kinase|nr:adenylate kinase [Cyanobacteria bacterium UBA8156]
MHRVILMGPPGAGKGTQGEILAQEWQVPRIAPGDIFRAEIKNNTPLGQKVKSYSDAGLLVPDAVVIEVMRDRLTREDAQTGWVLDGFPRTVPQAEALAELLQEIQQPCDRVINLTVPEEILLARLKQRAMNLGRADDTEEVIQARLTEYHQKTFPLLEFYGEQVTHVDGTPSLAEVTQALHTAVGDR